jgi:hypothetical protein
VYFHPK